MSSLAVTSSPSGIEAFKPIIGFLRLPAFNALTASTNVAGFGTSVTPVSQFYFQQAFTNTVQEKWSKISDSYGKMILGYFGKTPTDPNPEIMKIASEQLSLEPTQEDVHDLNDDNSQLGIEYNKKLLEEKGLETTDENIFISATCGEKGIAFLEGNSELGVRYKTEESEEKINDSKSNNSAPMNGQPTKVSVNGKEYEVIIHID